MTTTRRIVTLAAAGLVALAGAAAGAQQAGSQNSSRDSSQGSQQETRRSSTWTVSQSDGERTVRVEFRDGEVSAFVNGERVPAERIEMDNGKVRVLDSRGEVIFDADGGPGGVRMGPAGRGAARGLASGLRPGGGGGGGAWRVAPSAEAAYIATMRPDGTVELRTLDGGTLRAEAQIDGGTVVELRGADGSSGRLMLSEVRTAQDLERIIEERVAPVMRGRRVVGITLEPVPEALAAHLNREGGVMIGEVIDGQPAAAAGLRRYDIVLRVNGERVSSAESVVNAVRGGDGPVRFVVLRSGERREFEVEPTTAPAMGTVRLRGDAIEEMPRRGVVGGLRRMAPPAEGGGVFLFPEVGGEGRLIVPGRPGGAGFIDEIEALQFLPDRLMEQLDSFDIDRDFFGPGGDALQSLAPEDREALRAELEEARRELSAAMRQIREQMSVHMRSLRAEIERAVREERRSEEAQAEAAGEQIERERRQRMEREERRQRQRSRGSGSGSTV